MHRFASTSVLATAAAFLTVAGSADAQTPGCIEVEIQNVQPGRGSLMVAAYADEAGFQAKTAVSSLQVRASDAATMRLPLCGIASQSIALMVFQDVNGNGKLDQNLFGMPSEPWGASGTPAAMQAPSWTRTSVAVDAKAPVLVKLSS